MAETTADVVIVGAGHAGVQLAVTLAKSVPDLSVALFSDEDMLPYERPPLTKRLLYAPRDELAPVLLRSADYWTRSPVRLHLGEPVVAVDLEARVVVTASGERFGFGTLVWAAGGSATSPGLPGEDQPGVHGIRDFAHLSALRSELDGVDQAVVIGGGFVGLEIAAGLTGLGIGVSVVEVSDRLLARVAPPVVSDHFADLHRAHGVDLLLSRRVESFAGAGGRLEGVRLTDGTERPAQVAVIGVGMTPHVSPLLLAGAAGDPGGVDVDAECRTTLPGVYAIGDCARQCSAWSSTPAALRIESVHNAGLQAAVVARSLTGEPPALQAPPRFWSTQFGCELKSVGLPSADDEIVLRGDPSGGAFSAIHLRDDRLVAIDTINRPKDFARAQGLIAGRWTVSDRAALMDDTADLPRLQPVG